MKNNIDFFNNDREKSYVGNINTHVDFILFNKLDKVPVLVIEVDGFKYHDENETQLERDKIKNGLSLGIGNTMD